eukprot:TRINITY_DN16589_c0_g2_i1.p1 TRINITY_DN16589_c0_g2~~TRINITY_DN16589_c0_g2_i1.p1  ORF type:complete len:467 (+),score=83.48 TRINITY_DN16589_c0_g2_i1:237-1637(+)
MARRSRCSTPGVPPGAGDGPADDVASLSGSSASGSPRFRPSCGSQWTDPIACHALCMLILEDRKCGSEASSSSSAPRRPVLPPVVYAQNVAPFLRFDHPLPNMLYAFGGRNQPRGPLDTAEMFDTWNGRWVKCAPMPTRRAGSAAALLPDRRIIVVGGYNEHGIAEGLLSTCDVYNPFTMQWDEDGAAPLRRARWGHGCASLGGKVYVVGGCSLQPNAEVHEVFMETLNCCEVYDPEEDSWTPSTPLKIPRSGSRVVALDSRHLAAVGGCDDVFGRAESQPTVEIFDTTTSTWSLLETNLESPRTTAAVAVMGDWQLLVVGGAPSLASAEVFQISRHRQAMVASRWKDDDNEALCEGEAARKRQRLAIADMPEGRMGCQAAVVCLPAPGADYPLANKPSVVIVGGERCEEAAEDEWPRMKQFDSIPVFDVAAGGWRKDSESVMPAMLSARTAVALCMGYGNVLGAL